MIIKPGYGGDPVILPEGSQILDIGSGNNPLPEATCCIERDLGKSDERGGRDTIVPKCNFIIADIKDGIPFADKSFDFVNASHILEHLDDPVWFCYEISRIGKAGYLEMPNGIIEFLNGHTFHKWHVFRERGGGLLIIPKNCWSLYPKNKYLIHVIDVIEYNILFQTRYEWQENAKCRIASGILDIILNIQIFSMFNFRIVPDTPIDRLIVRIFGPYQWLRWSANR